MESCTPGWVWAEVWAPTQTANWTSVYAQAPLASALPSSGAKFLVRGKRKTYTWKEQSQLGPDPQSFCFHNLGSNPIPGRAVMATKSRGSTASHLAPALAPPFTAPPPYQDVNCQHFLRKDMTFIHVKSIFPTKRHWTHAMGIGMSLIRIPFQDHNM